MVKCCICGKEFKSITNTHLKKHNFSIKDYCNKFEIDSCQSFKGRRKENAPFLMAISNKMKGNQNGKGNAGIKTNRAPWNKGLKGILHPKSEFKKGNVPWRKGLNKFNDDRVMGISKKMIGKNAGRKHTEEARRKMIGRKNLNPNNWGISGFRKDLNCFFRSRWEANFARILNFLEIKWEYEQKRFYLSGLSYLPDFYLPDLNLFVEVKGSRFAKQDKRLLALAEEKPDFPIRILDGDSYQEMSLRYSNIIAGWEK